MKINKKLNITNLKLLDSLLGRFIFASFFLLPIFIFFSGTLLVNAFSHSKILAEQEKLKAHLYLLLGATEIKKRQIILPEKITEPRFNQINSGLYGFVFDKENKEVWRSKSALLIKKKFLKFVDNHKFSVGDSLFEQIEKINGRKLTLNMFLMDIEWVNNNEKIIPLRYFIATDNALLKIEINSYQTRLWQWLSAMGLALIILQIIIMHWGLKPLSRLGRELKELKNNKTQKLSNNYPKEIKPVIENFNAILEYEKQQRERYRNTMSDLAHSLKTPLAIMQSQLNNDDKDRSEIRKQINRINQIVSHQLKRAVIQANQSSIAIKTQKTSIQSTVDRLSKILSKVYSDKTIDFINLVTSDYFFYGDEEDLLEILGNLLDNVCKYGGDRACVNIDINASSELTLSISDNGPGIPKQLHTTLLERGARGDTIQTGQGIGLSVVADIIRSYNGIIRIMNNADAPNLSGTCFLISLPNIIRN